MDGHTGRSCAGVLIELYRLLSHFDLTMCSSFCVAVGDAYSPIVVALPINALLMDLLSRRLIDCAPGRIRIHDIIEDDVERLPEYLRESARGNWADFVEREQMQSQARCAKYVDRFRMREQVTVLEWES